MRHNTAWPAFLFLFLCFEIATRAASAQNVRVYVDNSEGDDGSVIDLQTLNTADGISLAHKVPGRDGGEPDQRHRPDDAGVLGEGVGRRNSPAVRRDARWHNDVRRGN